MAGHQLGWETIGFVERKPCCQTVLRKNFDPNIPLVEDIFNVTTNSFERADIITAGFPCQPYSVAGARRGVRDERALFPQTLEVIKTVRPSWVVLENVTGLLSISQSVRSTKVERQTGICDEDEINHTKIRTITEEMLFESICSDLEGIGYDVQAVTIPAVALGAHHKRDRVWIIGHSDERHVKQNDEVSARRSEPRLSDSNSNITDTSERQGQWRIQRDASETKQEQLRGSTKCGATHASYDNWQFSNWYEASTELCRISHGLPEGLESGDIKAIEQAIDVFGTEAVSKKVGFDCREIASRMNGTSRLKALGNSIYVPVAVELFKAIDATVRPETN